MTEAAAFGSGLGVSSALAGILLLIVVNLPGLLERAALERAR